jgi:hypothetical protein
MHPQVLKLITPPLIIQKTKGLQYAVRVKHLLIAVHGELIL